jgi:hypothetical protein
MEVLVDENNNGQSVIPDVPKCSSETEIADDEFILIPCFSNVFISFFSPFSFGGPCWRSSQLFEEQHELFDQSVTVFGNELEEKVFNSKAYL